MNLFLGKSFSTLFKLIGEPTTFVKKAIGEMMGGWFGGKNEEDEKMLNGSDRILGNPLSLRDLRKWLSSKNSGSLSKDLKAHWNGDVGSRSFSLHQFQKKCTSVEAHFLKNMVHLAHLQIVMDGKFSKLLKNAKFWIFKFFFLFWMVLALLLAPVLLSCHFSWCLTKGILSNSSLEKLI